MGSYLSIPLLALAAALQATVVPQMRILGGGPDLVFLCVLSWAVDARLEESVVWAFVGGIMQDLLSAAPTGVSCVGMILLVFVLNEYSRQVYRIGFVGLTLFILIGSLLHQILLMIILTLIGFQMDWLNDFGYVVVPTIGYNLLFLWPTYGLMRRFQRRVTGKRRISL
jgi:rod shape-determining protein MreD